MTKLELEALLEPAAFIGRCPQQVEAYLRLLYPTLQSAAKAPIPTSDAIEV